MNPLPLHPIDTTPITEWFDPLCSHCPKCGWSDFPKQAEGGLCPDCGESVTPPEDK